MSFAHRYDDPLDRELVALVSACCAFGNVRAILRKLGELFDRVGPSPSRAADRPATLTKRLAGFKHRLFRGEDLARLLVGARRVQRRFGSLGAAFASDLSAADANFLARTPDSDEGAAKPHGGPEAFREALARLCDRIRRAGGLPAPGERDPSGRRGPTHLLGDPRAGSAVKRLLLFVRWMVRDADGIDLGLWAGSSPISPAISPDRLLVPVDVHIHRLAKNLGFTRRRDVSWRTAVEITRALARFDEKDPTRYDFSLCHMGMLQRCPSKRDARRCEGCGVRPVCLHWPLDASGRS